MTTRHIIVSPSPLELLKRDSDYAEQRAQRVKELRPGYYLLREKYWDSLPKAEVTSGSVSGVARKGAR